jgi:hypothetical protein
MIPALREGKRALGVRAWMWFVRTALRFGALIRPVLLSAIKAQLWIQHRTGYN